MDTKSIALIALGGTISTVRGAGENRIPTRTSSAIASDLPLIPGISIVPVPAEPMSSRAMTPDRMLRLASTIEELGDGVDGIIVTHGTDTLEETAYGLALMVSDRRPIVLTGAMRLADAPGADGRGNLYAAAVVAGHRPSRLLGPLVVMDDTIHLARWVAKTRTTGPGAFASPGFGAIGSVSEEQVSLLIDRVPRSDFLGMPISLGPRVELLWAYAGMDGYLMEAAAKRAAGVVVAGTGGGHTSPALADAVESAIADGCTVVIASRCGSGPMLIGTYGGRGSEEHLRTVGAIIAGNLSPVKARLRLQIALAIGRAPAEAFPV